MSTENTTTEEVTTTEQTVLSVQDFASGNAPVVQTEVKSEQPEPIKNDNPEKVNEELKTELPDLKDEDVVAYLKSKGREVNSIDDVLNEPEPKEVVKEVNPYDEILDDNEKAWLKFKKETGKSREDYDKLNADLDKVSPLEFARERVLRETGLNLTTEQIDEYLNNELDITVDEDGDLSTSDLIKLAKFGKSVKEERIKEQDQFRKGLAENKPTETKTETQKGEWVELEGGQVMRKKDYDNLVSNHQKHLESNKESVNNVTESAFKIEVDENGEKRELDFKYEFDDKDRHSMVSLTNDTTQTIKERYYSDKGFDHKRFNEDMFWTDPKNREKAIGNLLQKARAEAIEEVLTERGNVKLQPNQGLHKQDKEGVKIVPVSEFLQGNF